MNVELLTKQYCTWRIYESYGAWCAENEYGSTIWALSYDELVKLFKDFGAEVKESGDI